MPYRVLALDGGGFRTLIPAALLQRIQYLREGFLDSIDLFAGSSMSGITALILAEADDLAEAADTVRTFWVDSGNLFKGDPIRDITAIAGKAAYFDNQALGSALKKIFGDRTIANLKRKILIPTIVLDAENAEDEAASWQPQMIQNLDSAFAEMSLCEAALRSAAMPILFPVRHGMIDGSMLANNPSLCAIAELLRAGTTTLKDIRVLSIGAGVNPIGIQAKNADWGYADWLFDHEQPLTLLQAVAENNCALTDFQCAQLLPSTHYLRLNPQLPKPWSIFEHSPRFVVQAGDVADETDLEPTLKWLASPDWTASHPSKSAPKAKTAKK